MIAPAPVVMILAAGGSTRMGRPKQSLPFRGTTLLGHAVETARAARLGPIIVVLGCEADSLIDDLPRRDVHAVINADWALGMGGSIAVGMATLDKVAPEAPAVLVMLADQPRVGPDLLRSLALHHERGDCRIAACAYDDALGVPALFDRAFFDDLRALDADRGARGVILRHRHEVRAVPIGDSALDIDTRDDYAQLLDVEPNFRRQAPRIYP